jgi:hypothetical protein
MKSETALKPEASGWLGNGTLPARSDVFAPRSDFEIDGWRVRGKPVSVKIPIDVIERLQRAIEDLNDATAPYDVTGLLIGRVVKEAGSTIVVDDYELARYTVENDRPSFHQDRQLQDIAKHWGQLKSPWRVVGFVRSQRRGSPAIEREDLRGAKRMLKRGMNTFLLIRTGVDGNHTGMLFLRKGRGAKLQKASAEFPFNADVLRA